MANTEVGLKLAVDAKEASEYLKKLKSDLKIAEGALLAIRDKFGETSKEAIQAGKVIAELRDKIQGAKEQANLFDPGKKFQAFTTAASQLAAGFSAVQGAMALAGNESQDLQKALVKVQAAMALSQGLSELKDLGKSYEQLKTVAVNAFSTMRKAMMTIGIGALVAGLGLVIANFDSFKKAIFNLIPGLKSVTDFVGNLVTKFTDFVGITSEAERNLEKFTKANNRANQTIDDQIKLLEAQGGKEDQIYNLKKQRGENELNNLRENLKVKGKLTEEELKQFRDLKNDQQVLDIEEVNRKKKLAEDEAKRQKELSDKAAEKRKQDAAKKKADDEAEKKRLEDLQKNTEENLKANAKRTKELQDQLRLSAITDEKEKAKVENQIKLQSELDAETERYKSGELRLEQYLLNIGLIRQRYANDDKARQEADKLTEEEREAVARQNTLEQQQLFNDQIIAAEVELQNRKFEAAQSGLNLLNSLAGQNEQLANVIFAVQKGLEIGRIVMDTARGIVAAKAGLAAVPPFIGFAPNPAFVKAAVIAAKQITGLKITAGASIASIAAASISKFRGGGGGGAVAGGGGGISTAAPVAPALAPQVEATQVNTAAVNQMGNRAARAYVLNSDIQNNEQRNAYIDRNASIG